MKKLILILFVILTNSLSAQEDHFYTPLEVQKAYRKNTRSADGAPGARYWQNRARYSIVAEIDTARNKLIGSETIIYFNNSPDSLDKIVIRLYQDIYKTGNARYIDIPKADIGEGVKMASISINGKEADKINKLQRVSTNLFIPLQEKLNPGDSISLSFKWSYTISAELEGREGKYPNKSWFIGLWYPQVAVYDDISGWDENEYKEILEFYNDFSDYDVQIKVPAEFVVFASGVLINPHEVLAKKYLDKYREAAKSDSIISIISAEDRKAKGVTVKNKMNNWHYTATSISDFAFGFSAQHLWDMTSLEVDAKTGKRILIHSVYAAETKSFPKAAEICRKAIAWFGSEMPGVTYPFPVFTAFNGSSAVEYPMMTNLNDYAIGDRFFWTLTHEISHTWFPMLVGTNERKYAFMDEGMAQMIPMDFTTREIRKTTKNYAADAWNSRAYEMKAGREQSDRPPAVISLNFDFGSWHNVNYERPGAAFLFMKDLLGEAQYKMALKKFISDWSYKHPTPYDFFNTVNSVAGEDLSWYWNPWFFEFGYPDLAVKEFKEDQGNRIVTIEKPGNIPVPISLKIIFDDDSTMVLKQTARVWEKGNKTYQINIAGDKKIKQLALDNRSIPDVIRRNNSFDVK